MEDRDFPGEPMNGRNIKDKRKEGTLELAVTNQKIRVGGDRKKRTTTNPETIRNQARTRMC